MKSSKLTIFAMLIAAALLLSACGTPAPEPTSPPTTAPSAHVEPTALPATTEPTAPAEPLENPVSADFATPELLGQYYLRDGCEEFDEFSDPDYQRIVFMAERTVTNFKYVPIEVADGDETVSFTIGDALYTLPELTPEKPLVIAWMEVGLFPNRGIAFTDETGTERVFAIVMSGEDGSLLLMELVADSEGSYVSA